MEAGQAFETVVHGARVFDHLRDILAAIVVAARFELEHVRQRSLSAFDLGAQHRYANRAVDLRLWSRKRLATSLRRHCGSAPRRRRPMLG